MSAFVPALASVAEIEHDEVLLRVSDPVGTETSSEAEHWSSLVHRIRQGEKDAVEELYRYFYGGIRLFLCRNLGPQELEDKVHDTFVIVLTAVRRGEVRDPTRMAAFVRTVVRRQVANHIGGVIHERRDCVEALKTYRAVDVAIPSADTII